VPNAQADFTSQLTDADSLWAATALLLRQLRADQPVVGAVAARDASDEKNLVWQDVMELTRRTFGASRRDGTLNDEDRALILRLTHGGTDRDALDAVAWGIALAAEPSFPRAWRDGVALDQGAPVHVMRPGDIYPVPLAPWATAAPHRRAPRPDSLTPPTAGELPGVRVFDDLGLEIRIDFSLEDRLEDLGHRLACCAGLHPNQSLGELVIPAGPQVHGVGPVDARRQAKAVENLLAVAAGRRADVAVLPELSMTAQLVDELSSWLDSDPLDDLPELVVAGSAHTLSGDGRRINRATGVLADSDRRMVHDKIVPFDTLTSTTTPPQKEALDPPPDGRPSLTIYHADVYRFCVLICKDLLSERVVRALGRMGVNIVLCPAMSARTRSFSDRGAQLRADAQAMTFIVNGPLAWSGGLVLPPAILCLPFDDRQQVEASDVSPAPAVSVLSLD
jgi:hypothetical protein